MPQFRLTQKYAKSCRISSLPEPQRVIHPLDDWFIDIVRINRKKIAMVTHGQSTFTFFIPYTEIDGATSIPKHIGILLKEFLYDHNLSKWAEQTEILFAEPVTFCKTVDKRILGHMNDFKRCAVGYIDYSPNCIHSVNWDQITEMINRIPVNLVSIGYIYPIEMLKKILGHSLQYI